MFDSKFHLFLFSDFNRFYREKFNESLDVERFGFSSCEEMLRALSQVLIVKGFGIKKRLVLRNHMRCTECAVCLFWTYKNLLFFADGPLSHSLTFAAKTLFNKTSVCLNFQDRHLPTFLEANVSTARILSF